MHDTSALSRREVLSKTATAGVALVGTGVARGATASAGRRVTPTSMVATHGHYAAFPLGPDSWERSQSPVAGRSGTGRWAVRPQSDGRIRCLVENLPEGRNAGFDLHLGPLGNVQQVTVESETVRSAGETASLFVGLYLDVGGDGDFFSWTGGPGRTQAWDGFGADGEGAAFPSADGSITVDDTTTFQLFHMEEGAETATMGDLRAGAVSGADGTAVGADTYVGLYVGVGSKAGAGREEVVVDSVTVHTPDSEGAATGLSGPETPVADPGSSTEFGLVGEAESDDLTASAANSEMSDRLKAAFDRLANHDLGAEE